MASISSTCEICHKPFRLIGVGGQTVEDLQKAPQVHMPGTEGDVGCFAEWQAQDAARQEAKAEAQLEAARSLVADSDGKRTSRR